MPHCPFCNPAVIKNESFYQSKHSRILYNIKPIFEGHVLVITIKHRERLENLTSKEKSDLFETVTRCNKILCKTYKKDSYSIVIQDGKGAGQTVPHFHIHIIPMNSSMKTKEVMKKLDENIFRQKISEEKMKTEIARLKKTAKSILR